LRFSATLLSTAIFFFACQDLAENDPMVKAYVTLQGIDKVAVIDVSKRVVLKNIDVDFQDTGDRPHHVVIDKTNGFWYVTLISSGYVLKYSLETDELVDSVRVGNMPALMALDEMSQTLYVSRFMPMPGMGMMASNSTVVNIIDASTMTVKRNLSLEARSPHGIALSPDGQTLWLASNEASHFFKIETSLMYQNNYQPNAFKLGSDVPDSYTVNDMLYNALELELSSDNSKLFITCSGSNEIRVFDTTTGDSLATYDLSNQPWHLAISTDNRTIYTTNRGAATVSKINLSNGDISILSDSLLAQPHGCMLTPDENELIVTASGGNRIVFIDSETMKLVDEINLETSMSMPTGLAVVEE